MYGRNKKRIESVPNKPKKSPETSMGSTLLSADDNNSVVRRPTNHINGICFCYENKEDCTTCTEEEQEEEVDSFMSDVQIFMLSDSDNDIRLLGGSTPTFDSLSSSDGSSLFDEEFSRKIQENLEINEKIGGGNDGLMGCEGVLSALSQDGSISDEVVSAILTAHTGTTVKPENLAEIVAQKSPKIDTKEPTDKTSRAWLEFMIRQLSETFPKCISGIETEMDRQSEWNVGLWSVCEKMKTMNESQIREFSNGLETRLSAFEVDKWKCLESIDNLDSSDFEVTRILMKKCKEEHAAVRREYLDRLFDEELMKSNLVRIAELKAKIESHRKLCRPKNVDTQVEIQQILDKVDTCQSFSYSDL